MFDKLTCLLTTVFHYIQRTLCDFNMCNIHAGWNTGEVNDVMSGVDEDESSFHTISMLSHSSISMSVKSLDITIANTIKNSKL